MSTIQGVAEIEIIGAANYAMRVWIDPLQLAARGVTAAEVLAAISASNFLSAPGKTENEFVAYNITMQIDAADARRPSARCRLRPRATRWCGCATSRGSSSRRRAATRSSPSTASRAPSSASSRRRRPTRSTPPRR